MHKGVRNTLFVSIGLLVCLFVAVVSWRVGVWETASQEVHGEVTTTQSQPQTTDPFVLGQYFFNHGGNPTGPYDLRKAQKYFLQAIAEDPKGNRLQWHQAGRIDFIEGRFASAIYKFNKQIEYFGEEIPNVYYMLGLTYGYRARDTGNEEDWRKAEEAFKHFIDIYHLDWASRIDLSWVYFAQGKYEEMKAPLEEALEAFPENPWVHNMYGLALMNTDDQAQAREHFLKAWEYANELTVGDWGEAYPGNDPKDWPQGLSEFRDAIEKNIVLAEEKLSAGD